MFLNISDDILTAFITLTQTDTAAAFTFYFSTVGSIPFRVLEVVDYVSSGKWLDKC